ncbi:MAG: hypothetical protein ACE366_23430 [Bradymonadia bacterium]
MSLWDPQSGVRLKSLSVEGNSLHRPIVSPNGCDVLAHQLGSLHHIQIDPDDLTLTHIRAYPGIAYRGGWFLHPGDVIVAANDFNNTVQLLDLTTGDEVQAWPLGRGRPIALVCSPDGQHIAVSGTKRVRVWSAPFGGKPRFLTGHSDEIRRMAFTPDSATLLTGSHDSTHRAWDVATCDLLWTVDADPDASFVCGDGHHWIGHGAHIERRNTTTGGLEYTWKSHKGFTDSLALHPGGDLLASSSGVEDRTRLWDPHTGERRDDHGGVHACTIKGAAQIDDDRFVTWDINGVVHMWSRATGDHLLEFELELAPDDDSHPYELIAAVCAYGDRMYIASQKRVYVHHMHTGALRWTYPAASNQIMGMGVSPDGETLVVCTALPRRRKTTEVYFYAADSDAELSTFKVRLETHICRFVGHDRLLTVSGQGALTWNMATRRVLKQVTFQYDTKDPHLWGTSTGTLSPDNSLWASGKTVIRVDTGEPYAPLRYDGAKFSPDSVRLFAKGPDNTVLELDQHSHEVLGTATLPVPKAQLLAQLPDQTWVCTAGKPQLFLWQWHAEVPEGRSLSSRMIDLQWWVGGEPSLPMWNGICDLFAEWPEQEGRAEGFAYAKDMLSTWPEFDRQVHATWYDRCIDGRGEPLLSLARNLRFKGRPAQLRAILTSPDLDRLSEVYVYSSPKSCLGLLSDHGERIQLRRLFLNNLKLRAADLERFIKQSSWLKSLEKLGIHGEANLGDSLITLMQVPFTELRNLHLGQCDFDVQSWGQAFERAHHLSSLKTLKFEAVDNRVVFPLCNASYLQLENLTLENCKLGTMHIDLLDRAEHFSSLESLNLTKNNGSTLCGALAESTRLTSLRHLTLAQSGLRSEDLSRLLKASFAPGLQTLDLNFDPLGDFDALVQSTHLTDLRSLSCYNCELTAEAFTALIQSEHLDTLEQLNLSRNTLGDIDALASAPHMTHLKGLDLSSCDLSVGRALQAVTRSPHLSRLERLSLYGNKGGLEDVSFEETAHLQCLRSLDLSDCAISTETLDAFFERTHMPALSSLTIWGAQLGARGAEALVNSPFISNVSRMSVHFTEAGRAVLLQSPLVPDTIKKVYTPR